MRDGRRIGRFARLLLCLLVFPVVVLTIGWFLTKGYATPDLSSNEQQHSDTAATILNSLSEYFCTINLSLIAATGVLIRFPEKHAADWIDWILTVSSLIFSAVSIFIQIRFRLDISTQLAISHLNMGAVMPRLINGAYCTLASTCCVLSLAIDRFRRNEKII